uniref:NADH-ubiquinone oxidoreductase chain 4L n=1 Tax=Sternoptyx diaphana TaxID=81873 RepID=A0A7L8XFL2_9TELE|nr:NADH dehydrogenase subunit 4L [Sternoptyx diaphana]QOH91620.1 NADH dehydrogenase subunit 4L [Sternoptyx diaphana]WNH38358.1 NADH dehydrogenase subunit 4L [Sternoptyx diaphana]
MTPLHFSFTVAFIFGFLGLVCNRVHLLSALLCLEGMMLSLYIALALWALQMEMVSFSCAPLFMLAFSACEASAGLGLLVATSRTHGTDRLSNMSLLRC